MPKTVEMVVGLKVPDTTAITALQTLHRMGFGKIKDIQRYDHYKFTIEGDVKKFQNGICKVDMLVNANKHSFDFSMKKDGTTKILVKNMDDDGEGILSTLKNRLGFGNIKKIEKAIMWSLSISADENESKKISENAANELLVNRHYQEYEIL